MTSPTTMASHGRGGAGNMADRNKSPKLTPADLKTPTLKTAVVTTGRGGSGNMARNDDPYETRLRQDVEAGPRRPSSGAQHVGRGGAANIFKPEDVQKSLDSCAIDDSASSRKSNDSRRRSNDGQGRRKSSNEHHEGLAAKGKAFLFGRK